MSFLMYDRLARTLAMLPALGSDMADELGIDRERMGRYLRFLHAEGVVKGAEIIPHRGRMYETGTLQRFERTCCEQPPAPLLKFCAVWHRLHRRQTVAQVAQALDLTEYLATRIVGSMHRHRVARISGWQDSERGPVAIFDLLPGSDAPRPMKSRAEINAAHWQRRRDKLRAAGLGTHDSVRHLQPRA